MEQDQKEQDQKEQNQKEQNQKGMAEGLLDALTTEKERKIDAIFSDCLFRPDELVDGLPLNVKDMAVAEGITGKFGFNRARLEGHRAEINDMLRILPEQFMKNSGGGWSFLNACMDRDGNQWANMHKHMEQLICLGIAIGSAEYCAPRELWVAMPGGMPYFMVDIKE